MINIGKTYKLPKVVFHASLFRLALMILLASIIFAILFKSASLIIGMFIFLWILSIPIQIIVWLGFRNISFIVEEKSLTINSGVISKNSTTIPFDGIQNIDCSTNPTISLFNLYQIKIWTASSAGMVVRDGTGENKPIGMLLLMKEDAEFLRKMILDKKSITTENVPDNISPDLESN